MVCIYCASPTEVTNSRRQSNATGIWRRRLCQKNSHVFTTYEVADLARSLRVKSGKRLAPFLKEKLLLSVYKSCGHRPDALEEAIALTQTIVAQLLPRPNGGLIDKTEIVDITAQTLERFDSRAATFYRAYHPASI